MALAAKTIISLSSEYALTDEQFRMTLLLLYQYAITHQKIDDTILNNIKNII
jgi:hypothetical protein